MQIKKNSRKKEMQVKREQCDETVKVEIANKMSKHTKGRFKKRGKRNGKIEVTFICTEEIRQAVGPFSQHDLYKPFATR